MVNPAQIARNFVRYGETKALITIRGNWAWLTGTYPLQRVRDATSYYCEGYLYSEAYRQRKWDGRKHFFNLTTGAFPAGLVPIVTEALFEADPQATVQVADERPESCPPSLNAGFDLIGIEFGRGKYDYQLDAAKTMVAKQRGVVKIATNGGKTAIAAAVTQHLGLPTLFLVERVSLLIQTRKRFASLMGKKLEDIGIIGDQNFELTDITIATPASLESRLDRDDVQEYVKRWQVLFADECFPAGTQVNTPKGTCSIESIQPGDLVNSFWPQNGLYAARKVTRILRKSVTALVRVRLTNGKELVCTPNHKIWTRCGWLKASELVNKQEVLIDTRENIPVRRVRNTCERENNTKQLRAVLSSLPVEASLAQTETSYSTMQMVPNSCKTLWKTGIREGEKQRCVLLRRTQSSLDATENVGNNACNKSSAQRHIVNTHETAEPHVHSQCCRKDEKNTKQLCFSVETSNTRRKWSRNDQTTDRNFECADNSVTKRTLGSRVSYKNWKTRWIWVSNFIQSGHRLCRKTRSYRTRWGKSLRSTKRARFEERPTFNWIGVDRIEIIEPGSDRTFGGLCREGIVYDLEVDGTHTYFANGVGVSNCHHLSADVFYSVVCKLPAYYRFGLSGTPLDRSDGSDLKLIAQMGSVIYEVSNKTLVERGISVPPVVHMFKIKEPIIPTKGVTWHQVHRDGVVRNDHLNNEVAAQAVSYAKKKNQVLVLVEHIAHGKVLLDKIKHATKLKAVYLTGSESGEAREAAFDQYRSGDIRILIATAILDEGVDIPNIDVLILAGGGKAKIRLLQRVGRGLRTGEGKTRLLVIDFALFCHPWLIKHSLARLNTYRREDCFDIKMMP